MEEMGLLNENNYNRHKKIVELVKTSGEIDF